MFPSLNVTLTMFLFHSVSSDGCQWGDGCQPNMCFRLFLVTHKVVTHFCGEAQEVENNNKKRRWLDGYIELILQFYIPAQQQHILQDITSFTSFKCFNYYSFQSHPPVKLNTGMG